MAKIKLNPQIKSISGRAGNIIYYNVAGRQYARSYSIPCNPRTGSQQKNRAAFGEVSKLWKYLPAEDRALYNKLAEGKTFSGYNIFVSMFMRGITVQALMSILKKQTGGLYIYTPGLIRNNSVHASIIMFSRQIYRHIAEMSGYKPPGMTCLAA